MVPQNRLLDSALLCLLQDSALLFRLQDSALLWPLLASSLLLLRWSRPALRHSHWSRPAPCCQSAPESLRISLLVPVCVLITFQVFLSLSSLNVIGCVYLSPAISVLKLKCLREVPRLLVPYQSVTFDVTSE